MSIGKALLTELLLDLIDFILQNRSWTCRGVNYAYDNYLNGRIGHWLVRINHLAEQIYECLRHILNFILNFRDYFDSRFSASLLQTKAEIALEFCQQLEILVPGYNVPEEISVDSDLSDLFASAKNSIRIWTKSAVNEGQLQLILGRMQQFRAEYSAQNVVRYDEKTNSWHKDF
ncbi:hypothetical protein niasHS_016655 [Heterodera schachtii]|uniref:Uncharacterized protein n=1 Tax=Heterodera schachtii TaxID=97005 RepID=A0ABD2HRK3_HETSC